MLYNNIFLSKKIWKPEILAILDLNKYFIRVNL